MESPKSTADPRVLARLTPVSLREVWANEASDFTPWLLENADVLADALGLDLELTDREHEVGSYYLDLIGFDLTNDCPLVVENQLTKTDHGHLGQLLTYAAGTDARTIVWVAPEFRDEHREAVDFLNTLTEGTARFFAVEISVVRIGSSDMAPLLRLVAKPNDWHTAVSASVRDAGRTSARGQMYVALWAKVADAISSTGSEHSRDYRAAPRNWFVVSRVGSLASICCSFARNGRIRVEVYLGRGSAQTNRELFDRLLAERSSIEAAIGAELTWEELDGRRACRIALYRDGDVSLEDRHEEYAGWIAESVERFKAVFTEELLQQG